MALVRRVRQIRERDDGAYVIELRAGRPNEKPISDVVKQALLNNAGTTEEKHFLEEVISDVNESD